MIDYEYDTYDGWSARGRRVIKGSTSHARSWLETEVGIRISVPLFHKDQTYLFDFWRDGDLEVDPEPEPCLEELAI